MQSTGHAVCRKTSASHKAFLLNVALEALDFAMKFNRRRAEPGNSATEVACAASLDTLERTGAFQGLLEPSV